MWITLWVVPIACVVLYCINFFVQKCLISVRKRGEGIKTLHSSYKNEMVWAHYDKSLGKSARTRSHFVKVRAKYEKVEFL